MKRSIGSIFIFMLFAATIAFAGKHPVPLDPKADSKTCLECHEDRTKGKVVHPALESGCLTCHFIRANGEYTNVVLKTPNTVNLCGQCHDDKKNASAKGHAHAPTLKDCTTCHEAHVGDEKGLLKKQAFGEKGKNLCLDCHTQGENVPKDGSRHAALDMGCSTCHVTHKVGERGKQEFDYHLTKAAPALCMDCHDVKDAELVKKHSGQPFGTAVCTECHDPHQSSSPKLMQAHQHAPFEDKTGCNTCHEAAVADKVKLNQPDVKTLCASCHDEVVKKIEKAKVQHPGAQGDCTDCHSPHAGKYAKFISPSPVVACLKCHSDQAEAITSGKALHDPAYNQSCAMCHEPHGGDREHLLRADVDTLCLTCHDPNARALKSPDGKEETIFGKSVHVPLGYVAKVTRIDLDAAHTGHPVPGHPTKGKDPRDATKQLSCTSCHNPHYGKTKLLLLSEDGSTRAMCKQCHKEQ